MQGGGFSRGTSWQVLCNERMKAGPQLLCSVSKKSGHVLFRHVLSGRKTQTAYQMRVSQKRIWARGWEPRIKQIVGAQKKLKRDSKASWAIFLQDITINLK